MYHHCNLLNTLNTGWFKYEKVICYFNRNGDEHSLHTLTADAPPSSSSKLVAQKELTKDEKDLAATLQKRGEEFSKLTPEEQNAYRDQLTKTAIESMQSARNSDAGVISSSEAAKDQPPTVPDQP